MKRLKWAIEFVFLVLLTLPLALLPLRMAIRVGGFLGGLLYAVWKDRREIAIDNLKQAVANNALSLDGITPEQIIRENFRNLGKSFAEIVKIYYGLGEHIVRDIEITGAENLTGAIARGKGVIMITGHCGNWELLCLPLVRNVPRINAVMRRINNPFLDRIIIKIRERSGQVMVYKEGAVRRLFAALKRNEIVGILMDQSVVPSEGIKAEFLGRKDYILKIPATIARRSGAAVVPAFISRTAEGHKIDIGKAIEPDASAEENEAIINDTVNFSSYIEDYIRKHPSEWLWLHRRWKREDL